MDGAFWPANPSISGQLTPSVSGHYRLALTAITEIQEFKTRQEYEKQLAGSVYNDEDLIFCTSLGKKLDTRRLYELHCRALKGAGIEQLRSII